MKKTLFVVITGMMLAGTFSAVAAPTKKATISPATQSVAPLPMCSPQDPHCK